MRTLALETAVNICAAITLLYGLWAFLAPRLIAGKYLLRKKHLVRKKHQWDVLYLSIQFKLTTTQMQDILNKALASKRKRPMERSEPPPPGARQN